MFRLIHFLIYLIYRAGAWVIGLLPLESVFRIGQFLGACAFYVLPRARRTALENLTRAYGSEKSPAELHELAARHFRLLGANLLSGIKLSVMPPGQIAERVSVEIPESVAVRRRDAPAGWVAVISHIGNWEIYAQLCHLLPEFRLGAVYHPVRNRFIDSHLRRLRSRLGVELFDRRSGLTKAARFLRGGGAVGVLIDQYAGAAGVWTPFFGRLASTSPLAATLAVHAGAPVVPIAVYTIGIARWRVVASPLIEAAGDAADRLTAVMNRKLEEQIRESPADWLWSHNRWKTPRPHFLFGYHQRGLAAPPGPVSLQPFRILVVSPRDPEEAESARAAVRAIKDSRPDAEITVLAGPETVSIWNTEEAVHRVLTVGRAHALFQIARVIKETASFDAAFLFSQKAKLAFAARFASIPVRVGAAGGLAAFFVNRPVSMRRLPEEPAYYLELAQAAGAKPGEEVAARWSGLPIRIND